MKSNSSDCNQCGERSLAIIQLENSYEVKFLCHNCENISHAYMNIINVERSLVVSETLHNVFRGNPIIVMIKRVILGIIYT